MAIETGDSRVTELDFCKILQTRNKQQTSAICRPIRKGVHRFAHGGTTVGSGIIAALGQTRLSGVDLDSYPSEYSLRRLPLRACGDA
jgi:hypothetical protein